MQPLGRRLRQIRQDRDLSMREAAEWVDVDHTSWSRWEGDQTIPNREHLGRISEVFREDLSRYFNGNLARRDRRIAGRIWSLKAEQNVAKTYNIGGHIVELLKDGNLVVNSRTVVLAET